ncbi:MAG: efflux RND transporter permease subunit [Marinilabiliales bacterium]|nr:efflux RND transporter permease subunit [Marinilabiliales bacterium]
MTGKEESEVVIETNKYLLESFGLTSDGIAAQISNYNRNVSGGSIVDMGTKYVVKGVSVLEDLEDLENIIVGFKQASSAASAAAAASMAAQRICFIGERVPVYLQRCCNDRDLQTRILRTLSQLTAKDVSASRFTRNLNSILSMP